MKGQPLATTLRSHVLLEAGSLCLSWASAGLGGIGAVLPMRTPPKLGHPGAAGRGSGRTGLGPAEETLPEQASGKSAQRGEEELAGGTGGPDSPETRAHGSLLPEGSWSR